MKEKVEQEKRTIDLRVEQASDAKALELLKTNQQWVQSQAKRLQLFKQRNEQYRQWLTWLFYLIGRNLNTWMFFVVWTVAIGTWGWIGGINTPNGIFCPTRSSLCYSARFWGEKKALSDVKNPQCTQTRQGLMCLVKPASKQSAP